ncbi:MAG: T9SS type A sorting domain-containing protein [Bacteroidetes bacterium]|nr:T9SS type A sorting domain-containing protein [Bacteroidota bacterium]
MIRKDYIIQKQSLRIDHLARGIYLLSITTDDGIYRGKFLVE